MKLLILDSHPIQYHAPAFREVSRCLAGRGWETVVVYLNDCSIRGFKDKDFGVQITWDEPLLEGYRSLVVASGRTGQPEGFWSLRAPDIAQILDAEKPDRILVHTLNYKGAYECLWHAWRRGIPCMLRVETSDEAFGRSAFRAWVRGLAYRFVYAVFDSAVAIGSRNRRHLIAHGIPARRIAVAFYSTPDRFRAVRPEDAQANRASKRQELALADDRFVLLFSGKLIPKKDPLLILQGIAQLPVELRARMGVIFLGSGELETELRAQAAGLPEVAVHFAGFKNQTELMPYYLAADALVLASRQAGETWGLVVNEGLQAGLPVIVSNAVGSSEDLGSLPHVQVIDTGSVDQMAAAIQSLAGLPRDFQRYAEAMSGYSMENAGRIIADAVVRSSNPALALDQP